MGGCEPARRLLARDERRARIKGSPELQNDQCLWHLQQKCPSPDGVCVGRGGRLGPGGFRSHRRAPSPARRGRARPLPVPGRRAPRGCHSAGPPPPAASHSRAAPAPPRPGLRPLKSQHRRLPGRARGHCGPAPGGGAEGPEELGGVRGSRALGGRPARV